MNQLRQLIELLRVHKWKAFFLIGATIIFLLILFPYNDLGVLVATKTTELTNNQVFVQFEELGFGLSPKPGIEMGQVFVQSAFFPSLKMDKLYVAPSWLDLFTFKLGLSLNAKGLFGGELSASWREGMDNEIPIEKLNVSVEHLSLERLKEVLELPIALKGNLSLDSDLKLDLEFNQQPSGEIALTVSQFVLPVQSFETAMGPMTIPELKISKVNLEGRWVNGEIVIDEAKLGDPKDVVYGSVKGNIGLVFKRRGVEVSPQLGSYEIKTDLYVTSKAPKDLDLVTSLVMSKCKNSVAEGARYLCKLTATGPDSPLRALPINSL